MKMKFELGQLVYFLKSNKVHSAPVLARRCCEIDESAHTAVHIHTSANPDWEAGELYCINHGIYSADLLFASIEDLKDSL